MVSAVSGDDQAVPSELDRDDRAARADLDQPERPVTDERARDGEER
jgi:hypothetical protein